MHKLISKSSLVFKKERELTDMHDKETNALLVRNDPTITL